jgi:hypothetical protein
MLSSEVNCNMHNHRRLRCVNLVLQGLEQGSGKKETTRRKLLDEDLDLEESSDGSQEAVRSIGTNAEEDDSDFEL